MEADTDLKDNSRSWTDEQHRAIVTRDVSVALSAGAGCGKTFVLTARFLSHLDPGGSEPTQLGQLIAITFTERAAREMRDRIRRACHKRLLECPDHQAEHWLQLLRELDTARISTIHSFCVSLLRSHAVEAGLDPRFQVLDQSQANILLVETLDNTLRNKLADGDEDVLNLVARYGLGTVREMIERLIQRGQEIDWSYWRTINAAELVKKWEDFHRRQSLPHMLQQIAASAAAKTVLEIARQKPCTHAVMQERMAFLLEHLPRLPECDAPGALLPELREATMLQGAGTKKNWASLELYEIYKNAVTKVRKTIDELGPKITFDTQAALPAAEMSMQLLCLTDETAQAYDKAKNELGMLDFNDLLIRAKNLLVGEEQKTLRRNWAANLRLLLVDEFQDTDPLQVELVKALCDHEHTRGKLFFVGDFKQSIYRFRGADPSVFRRLSEEIPSDGRMPLSSNFRSQPAILDFVNALFDKEFSEYEPLRAHKLQVGPQPAVELLWAVKPDGSEENESAGDLSEAGEESEEGGDDQTAAERRRRREAEWIGRRIRAMLDEGDRIVWDQEAAQSGKPATRPVRPGDIALLFRALSDVAYYEEALRRYGIDYYLVGGHAFYAQQEVFDLLNLLRTLESPCDEVSLLGVLRSPFFNLLDETIFWLARAPVCGKRDNPIFVDTKIGTVPPEGLAVRLFAKKLPLQIGKKQRQQAKFAAKTITELRAMKDRVPIARLISEVLERTGYDALLLTEFLGERKLANLEKLIDQARSFDQAGIFTLSDFITQLAEYVVRQPDEPLAATQAETMNVVRLMTIHQAKGLEFPVVIVPDLLRSQRGPMSKAAFSPELGPMIKDDEVVTGYDLYSIVEKEETNEEDLRLLYVAATRAADYLILSSGVEKLDKIKGPWLELLARRFDLLSGKALHGDLQVKVIIDEPLLTKKAAWTSGRTSLRKLWKTAEKAAQKGEGRAPKYLAAIAPDPNARRQFSFSRLSGMLHGDCPNFRFNENGTVPLSCEMEEFMEPSLDPLGLGTLVHAVLAQVDFAHPENFAEIVQRLAPMHLEQANVDLAEPVEMIGRFLASPRAAQISTAEEVHRELEFLLAWPPGSRDPEGRYLQGFIDCLYRDQDSAWHIIDFKTNHVAAENLAQVAAEYEMQMLVYALAAEKILKSPPVELMLCFLRPGLEYRFEWDDNARKRVVEIVNQCLP